MHEVHERPDHTPRHSIACTRAWQEERKEGEGSNLVIGALVGSVALSIPFYWKNVARLGTRGACHRLPLLRRLTRCHPTVEQV